MVGAVGNFVECFDWFAYALFASYISRQVFPAGDPLAGCCRPSRSSPSASSSVRWGASSSASIPIATDARTRWRDDFPDGGWQPDDRRRAHVRAGGLAVSGDADRRAPAAGAGHGRETSAGGSYIVEASPARHRGFSGSFYISVGLGTLSASLAGSLLTQPADAGANGERRLAAGVRAGRGAGPVRTVHAAFGRGIECSCRSPRPRGRRIAAACAWSRPSTGPACSGCSWWPSVRPWRSISGSAMCRTSCAPRALCPRPPPSRRARWA